MAKKVTNTSAVPKNIRKKMKLIASVILAATAILILALVLLTIFSESPNIGKASTEWENQFSTSTSYILPVNEQDGNIYVMIDNGWEKIGEIPTSTPNWVKTGVKDARKGDFNKQALFAARLLNVESQLSSEEVQEIWALGKGYFENSKNDYNEETWETLEASLIGRLEGF